jgi:hypothetical protein
MIREKRLLTLFCGKASLGGLVVCVSPELLPVSATRPHRSNWCIKPFLSDNGFLLSLACTYYRLILAKMLCYNETYSSCNHMDDLWFGDWCNTIASIIQMSLNQTSYRGSTLTVGKLVLCWIWVVLDFRSNWEHVLKSLNRTPVLWLSMCCWKLGLVWIWIVVRRALLETTCWQLGLVWIWIDACCWKLGLVWIWIVLDFD